MCARCARDTHVHSLMSSSFFLFCILCFFFFFFRFILNKYVCCRVKAYLFVYERVAFAFSWFIFYLFGCCWWPLYIHTHAHKPDTFYIPYSEKWKMKKINIENMLEVKSANKFWYHIRNMKSFIRALCLHWGRRRCLIYEKYKRERNCKENEKKEKKMQRNFAEIVFANLVCMHWGLR